MQLQAHPRVFASLCAKQIIMLGSRSCVENPWRKRIEGLEGPHAWRAVQPQINTVDAILHPSLTCLLATSPQDRKLIQTNQEKNTRDWFWRNISSPCWMLVLTGARLFLRIILNLFNLGPVDGTVKISDISFCLSASVSLCIHKTYIHVQVCIVCVYVEAIV